MSNDNEGLPAALAEVLALAEKATPGEWEAVAVESSGSYGGGPNPPSGFDAYSIQDGKGRVLMDSLNSDHQVAMVREESDDDGRYAWDEAAEQNAGLIAASVNFLRAHGLALTRLLAATPASDEAVGDAVAVLRKWYDTEIQRCQHRTGPAKCAICVERNKAIDTLAALSARTAAPAEQGVTDAVVERACVAAFNECDMGLFPQEAVAPDSDRRFVRAALQAARLAPIAPDARSFTELAPIPEPETWANHTPLARSVEPSDDAVDDACVLYSRIAGYDAHADAMRAVLTRSVDGLSGEES